MPRKNRRDEPGAAHHGFPRGNNRADIFHDDGDRQVLLVILGGVVEAFGWDVRAYCLMRNHFHIVVRTPVANFGCRDGHVFKRPFKSERIKDERQLATAVRYVAENPVRAGICVAEADWRWSSHGTDDCVHRQLIMVRPATVAKPSPAASTPAR